MGTLQKTMKRLKEKLIKKEKEQHKTNGAHHGQNNIERLTSFKRSQCPTHTLVLLRYKQYNK